MNYREMALARIPVTVYKEDPDQASVPAEWHEVWCATNSTEKWVFCENHGWWDNANKQAYFNVPILSEPFKTEQEANDRFDARMKTLEGEGWIHKLTATLDYRAGRIIPHKIP